MKRSLFALWLFSCGVLPAQTNAIAVSPSSVSYRIRDPKIYPGLRYISPAKQVLTVQAAAGQNWSVGISGTLLTGCLYSSPCFAVTPEYNNTPITSGTGPARVTVDWYGLQGPAPGPGVYTGTITFTLAGGGKSASVVVSLEIVGAAVLPATAEPRATALSSTGCVNALPSYSYTLAVECGIPNEAPIADPALTQPAVGKSFIDPVFGGKITRITGPGCTTEYGTTTAFSANGTYIWNSCGVYRTADATQVRGPGPNIALTMMSATDDEVYYYFAGSSIHKYNFITNTDAVIGDFGGDPYNFTTLFAGGTAPLSEDNWLAFFEYSSGPFPKVCAVDLAALEAAGRPNPSNTYCGVYTGIQPLTDVDWAAATENDDATLQRYVYVSAIPLSMTFSVGAAGSGQLQQNSIVPEWPGWARNNDDGICLPAEICYNAANFTHLSPVKDRDGQVKLFGPFQDILLNRYYATLYRLSAGVKILRPEAEGGGLNLLGRINWDIQPGCSSRIAACTVAGIESPQRFAARVLQMDRASDKTRLTLSASPGWTAYSLRPVRIQNGTGAASCLNGAWTATVLPNSQVEIPAVCTGSGGLDKVLLGDASQPFSGSDNDNRSQIQIWRPERQIHRVAMHRSVAWNDIPGTGVNSYYTTTRASISRDGRFVAFNSNWGALDFDGVSVYIVETGLGAPENRIAISDLAPAADSAALSYTAPAGVACTFELSADPTFQHPLETFTDDPGTSSRLTYLGRAQQLTPSTLYWMRMQCGMEVESKAFRTGDTLWGFARTIVTEVGPTLDGATATAVVEYRTAGTSTFTDTPAQPCSGGCQISWPGMAGAVAEYRVIYLNQNDAVINTTPIYTIAVPR